MEKVAKEAEYASVTRAECLNCNRDFELGSYKGPQGKKKFCSQQCRWDYHNKRRLDAVNKIKTMAIALKTMAKAALELTDGII